MGLTKVTYSMIEGAAVNVLDFGAVGDGVTNSAAAIQAAADSIAGTGATLYLPNGIYLCNSQIQFNRIRVLGDSSTLKFNTLGATTDCVILQGSTAETPLEFSNITVDANDCGRDAVVVAGGKTGFAQSDFLSMNYVNVINAVRDGVHIEPAAAFFWIEDFELNNVRVTTPGRHGFSIVIPDYNAVFVNQGAFNNCEVRGAGLTTTGYDVYADCLATSYAGAKASEITFINCEFDAANGTNHGQASVQLNRTGAVGGDYDGWSFINCTFEDVGGLIIVGFPPVIEINDSMPVRNPVCIGGLIAQYGEFVDITKVEFGAMVKQATGNRNFYMMHTTETLRWATGNARLGYDSANVVKAFGGIVPIGGYINRKTIIDSSVTPAITLTKAFSKVYLKANVTGVTMPTVTSADDGLKIIVQFLQDVTGGRTVSGWPVNVLFSGGSFTPTATASFTSGVELIYDSTESKWYEVSRSLNM
jgi:hypothetical protein